MNWHTDVTIGDLHYLRSKFAESRGAKWADVPSFNRGTEAFYHNKQFRINGAFFLTWAYLTPEREIKHITGSLDYFDDITVGSPWIIEAYMPGKALSAMKELRHLIPTKILRFRQAPTKIGFMRLP